MKTTKKDFEYFKKCVRKYIKYYGLKRYKVFFNRRDIGDNFAKYNLSETSKTVLFSFTTDYNLNSPRAEYKDWIKGSAFHEVTHVLIARLGAIAGARYIGCDEIEEAEHDIIRTLENTLLQDLTKWREKNF